MRLVELAHQEVAPHLCEGSIAIDATLGNGFDTLFLAKSVGPTGKVFGFDIQPVAIDVVSFALKTRRLHHQCNLILDGHENLASHIPPELAGKIAAIMFNLGYLPHGDKTLTTCAQTTITALNSSIGLLAPNGILSILAYRGHPGGLDECNAVLEWTDHLPAGHFRMSIHEGDNTSGSGPILILLRPSTQIPVSG